MKLIVDPEGARNVTYPNVGLAYLSASLLEEHRIVDQYLMPHPRDRFMDIEADWLGISVKMSNYREAERIYLQYRSKYPGAKAVMGGPYITCGHKRIKNKLYNVEFFLGEWDYTDDLDSLPFPDYSKFDSFDYLTKSWASGSLPYPIITSRGCPYSCVYCAVHLVCGRKWRARSAENCYEELKRAKEKWNIQFFDVLDDCFNLSKKRLLKFCELVKPLGLRWACGNGIRADRFDDEIARAMYDAGCRNVSFGVESIVPDVLAAVNKGETIEEIERGIDVARKYFGVGCFLIIGLPGSTYEKDLESLRWAVKKRLGAHFQYLVPFEGTELLKTHYPDRLFDDSLTFGLTAEPVSDAYPKEKQKKIFEMSAFMRPEASQRSLLENLRNAVDVSWQLDPVSLPYYSMLELWKAYNNKKKLEKT